MKMKQMMAVVMMVLGFAASAGATEVGTKIERGYNTTGQKDYFTNVEVNATKAIGATGFAAGGKLIGSRGPSKQNGLTAEIGGSYSFMPGLYAKAGLGEQFNNGVDSYTYYNFGAGASLKVADSFRINGDIERTNAFNSSDPYFTTYKVGGDYDVAKHNTLGLNFVRRLGDRDTKGLEATYSLQF